MPEIASPLSGKACRPVKTIGAGTIVDLYRKEYDIDVSAFFGNDPLITIYECPDSGYRFYHPFTVFGDPEFYAQLENRSGYYPDWKWENEIALRFIPENSGLLDIGCGNGSFIRQLSVKRKINATGIDTNSSAVREGKNLGSSL
ncbi:MAG TPA: methionine biosynthesis protein MetW, partial [Bacteroidia bacterium]|nr:methionine biosynthesis protein MetW [Bacteroidia bacterium]